MSASCRSSRCTTTGIRSAGVDRGCTSQCPSGRRTPPSGSGVAIASSPSPSPRARSARTPLGQSTTAVASGRTRSARSSSVTCHPERASTPATAIPPSPAPTTTALRMTPPLSCPGRWGARRRRPGPRSCARRPSVPGRRRCRRVGAVGVRAVGVVRRRPCVARRRRSAPSVASSVRSSRPARRPPGAARRSSGTCRTVPRSPPGSPPARAGRAAASRAERSTWETSPDGVGAAAGSPTGTRYSRGPRTRTK